MLLTPPKDRRQRTKTTPGVCRRSTDAINYWREQIARQPKFKETAEAFWALSLDAERRFTGAHAVRSRSLGDAQKFADEMFADAALRGVPEFVLIHHRPRVVPEAGAADVQRVRAIILAGRAKKTELLDCLIIGKPSASHPSGSLSFYKMKGFSAADPFAGPERKQRNGTK